MFRLVAPVDETWTESIPAGLFAVGDDAALVASATWLDTFDWRLFNRGRALLLAGGELTLASLDGDPVAHTRVAGSPSFAWDLPAGRLRKQVEGALEMRALLPRAQVRTTTRVRRLLNDDQKTVLRLALDEVSLEPGGGAVGAFVRLLPVRGYDGVAAEAAGLLTAGGARPLPFGDYCRIVLEAAGQQPGGYQSKPAVALDPAMPAGEALTALLRAELGVIRINEPYIARDIDSEFLHDYRVALRRTRSALAEVKDVFAAAATARFRSDLQAANQHSNDLRDLDVYLLSEQRYRQMLPASLQDSIGPLFDHLRARRKEALAATVAALESPAYRQIMARWAAFLEAPLSPATLGAEGDRPALEVASRRIYRQYRRTLKDGRAITATSEDAMLHALRIECKKLRYLLELFGGLYPAQEIDGLVKQLRTLQGNLGDFNDLSVQEAYLMRTAADMAAHARSTPETMMAVGALVSALDSQRSAVRSAFADAFAGYAARDTRQRFRQVFDDDSGGPAETDSGSG